MIKRFYELDGEQKLSVISKISFMRDIPESTLVNMLENDLEIDDDYIFETNGDGSVKVYPND